MANQSSFLSTPEMRGYAAEAHGAVSQRYGDMRPDLHNAQLAAYGAHGRALDASRSAVSASEHDAAASSHRAAASMHADIGDHERAGYHTRSAAMHAAHAEHAARSERGGHAPAGTGHALQHGKKGGSYYLSPSGQKVYVGKGPHGHK